MNTAAMVSTDVKRTRPSCICIEVFLVFLTSTIQIVKGIDSSSLCELSSFDNAKVKGNAFYIDHVSEDWSVGTSLSHLVIRGTNADIELSTSEPNEYLTFDTVTRNLTVVKPLRISSSGDRLLRMTLSCKRIALKTIIKIPVTILLEDVNDSPPAFEQDSYKASVSELAAIGTTVISDIIARDADPDNWLVSYHILPGDYSEYFSIPIPSRGQIVLTKPLDFESVHKMTIQVAAKDNHLPVMGKPQRQLSSTVLVTVTIDDEDDLNPVFTQAVFMADVIESDIAGTIINVQPPIKATDPDTSFNSTLYYTFAADPIEDETSYFSIDPLSGVVSLRRDALPRGSLFSLLVKATQSDNEDRYASALLRIRVQAANENAPKFIDKHQAVSLLENAPIGTFVTTVSAIDNDEKKIVTEFPRITDVEKGAVLNYSFTNNADQPYFTIDEKSGTIRTKSEVDYEAMSQHHLTIQVSDGKHVDDMTLTVDLVDINDNNPQFSQSVYEFHSDKRAGVVIGSVQATDSDSHSSFTFSFLDNTTLFSINELGEVRLLAEHDDITQSTYSLYVRVLDGGNSPRQGLARVVVNFDLAVAVKAEQQMGTVAIIILGVLVGCLLLIIAIMMIHICKSNRKEPTTTVVRSGSFEGDLHLDGAGYKSYYDDGAEGLAYKPRHLSMYNGITLDSGDSTAMQENPFVANSPRYSDSITPRFISQGNSNSAYMTQGSDSIAAQSIPSAATNDSMIRRMAETQEMDDDLAVVPTHQIPEYVPAVSSLCSSEQSLIERPSKPVTSVPSSGSNSARDSALTSFNGGQHSTFNPASTTQPTASVVSRAKVRPGITVYY